MIMGGFMGGVVIFLHAHERAIEISFQDVKDNFIAMSTHDPWSLKTKSYELLLLIISETGTVFQAELH